MSLQEKAHELARLLLKGFEEEIRDTREQNKAILFSGGLDSAIVARVSKMVLGWEDTTLYTLGVEGSKDVRNAMEGLAFIDLPWKGIIVTEGDILKGANSLLSLVQDLDFLELSYELPLFLGAGIAEGEVVLTGQGADELFGGYARYREVEDPLPLMEKDRGRLLTRTLRNEKRIASSHEKVLVTPFLNDGIVKFAASLQKDELIGKDGTNKVLLREAARVLGLPELFCSRRKLDVQYGSGISRVLKGLRKKGELRIP